MPLILLGHSANTHITINPLLLAYEALVEIMHRFHEKYAPHPLEAKYRFKKCEHMISSVLHNISFDCLCR